MDWAYYQEATHTHKDEDKLKIAVGYLTVAAEAGYAHAIHFLGTCYRDGKGVQKNPSEAFKLFMMAAEQGVGYAKADCGNCYEFGIGIAQSKTEAKKWYRAAEAQGLDYVKSALNRLSTCTIM